MLSWRQYICWVWSIPVGILAIAVLISNETLAQSPQIPGFETLSSLERGNIGSYIASIPNPESELAIISIATNGSVANELGLADKKLEMLRALVKESGGSLGSPSATFEYSVESGLTYDESIPTAAEVSLILAEKRAKNALQVNEILNATQIARMKQLVFQIEIARVGLEEALVEGFLGVRLGIESHQKPALGIRARAIQIKATEAVSAIKTQALREMLQGLSEEQQTRVELMVGKWFMFRNGFTSLSFGRLPDPESLTEVIELLKQESIVEELKLGRKDCEATLALLADLKSPFAVSRTQSSGRKMTRDEIKVARMEKTKACLEKIEDILDPGQRDRLKEISYQLEIAKKGFGEAVVNGFLSKAIGVTESQKGALGSKIEMIQGKMDLGIEKVVAAANEELISALEPLQRIEAKKVLGKAFAFRE